MKATLTDHNSWLRNRLDLAVMGLKNKMCIMQVRITSFILVAIHAVVNAFPNKEQAVMQYTKNPIT